MGGTWWRLCGGGEGVEGVEDAEGVVEVCVGAGMCLGVLVMAM